MRRTGWVALFSLAAVLAFLPVSISRAAPLSDCGVVLMHGKGGIGGSKYLSGVASAMRAAGAVVVMPDMPWSRSRMYDATYEQAMAQIDMLVKKLRSSGKKKIIVGGQSFGANAAIGYAVRHDDIAGVLALAPGHVPESTYFVNATWLSVDKAKKMIAEGKSHQRAQFEDLSQGRRFQVTATPEVYLSYFDPKGPASMTGNAEAMKPVPIFLAVGKRDPILWQAHDGIFKPAAKNSKSKYLEIDAGHLDTPAKVTKQTVSWIAGL
jgi:dienelactone hydrolase